MVKYNIPICEFYNTGRYIMRNAMKIGLALAALVAVYIAGLRRTSRSRLY